MKRKKGKHEAPKRKLSKARTRESILMRNRLKLQTLGIVLCVFCLGFFYLGTLGILEARIQEQAYLEQQLERTRTESERLRLEIGYKDTLDLVEKKAKEELGMVEADQSNCVLVLADRPETVVGESGYPEVAAVDRARLTDIPLLSGARRSIDDILMRWKF